MLRDCPPSSVLRFLEELPESLDETYERVLREIKKPNRDHARRLLQCLVVAIRPLRVEELAEMLAIDEKKYSLVSNETLRLRRKTSLAFALGKRFFNLPSEKGTSSTPLK